MTRYDRVITRLEEYLDEYEGNTVLPDHVRDAVRAELPQRRQSRPHGLARFITMSSTLRYGLAAVVIGVAALVGWSFLSNTSVGPPSATPTPQLSGSAAALPTELQHLFVGPIGDPSTAGTVDTTQLEFSAHSLVVDPNAARRFTSDAASVGSDSFTLTATSNLQGCSAGDEGTYAWQLSPVGTSLTLAAESDTCPDRAAALTGTWLRVTCKEAGSTCLGPLDAGSYMSAYFLSRTTSGAFAPKVGRLTYIVPSGWANSAEWPDGYELTPAPEYAAFDGQDCYDCAGVRDTITVLLDPQPAAEDCSEAAVPGVGTRAADLVAWLSQHPGLTASGIQQTTLDGRPLTSLTITARSDWTGTCPDVVPIVAVPILWNPSYEEALLTGDSFHLVLMDIGPDHTIAILVDAANTTDVAAMAQRAAPIIGTFRFHE